MTITEAALSPTADGIRGRVDRHRIAGTPGLRETGTTTAYGTVGIYERIPGEEILVLINDTGPFGQDEPLEVAVVGFDGTVYQGDPARGGGVHRYRRIFEAHDDVTTVVHVHSPHLGAWAQTHRPLPINYVPVQRFNLVREIPIYIDRTQGEDEFILEVLAEDPDHFATLEANGGSTVWGRKRSAAYGRRHRPSRRRSPAADPGRGARRVKSLRAGRARAAVQDVRPHRAGREQRGCCRDREPPQEKSMRRLDRESQEKDLRHHGI